MWLFDPNKVWREVMTPRRVCYIRSHLMNLHTFLQSRVTLRNPIAVICLALISLYTYTRNLLPHTSAKDIHDFDGVHGDWLKHAAVTLVVHHHHEEITAGDLLNHKGPANHSTDSQIEKERKKDGKGTRDSWKWDLASSPGAWVWCKFPCVSRDLCYESSHAPLAEGRSTLKRLHWMHVKSMKYLTASCQ